MRSNFKTRYVGATERKMDVDSSGDVHPGSGRRLSFTAQGKKRRQSAAFSEKQEGSEEIVDRRTGNVKRPRFTQGIMYDARS